MRKEGERKRTREKKIRDKIKEKGKRTKGGEIKEEKKGKRKNCKTRR